MIHVNLEKSAMQHTASELMAQMETTNVEDDGEIKGQYGRWEGSEIAILWQNIHGEWVLYQIATERFVFNCYGSN